MDGRIFVTVKVVETCSAKETIIRNNTNCDSKFEERKKVRINTFDAVSTLTSSAAFLCLYCAAKPPEERLPFFATVERRAWS